MQDYLEPGKNSDILILDARKEYVSEISQFKPSSEIFQGGTSFVDHLCFLCLAFLMLSRLFIAALWSPAGKGLTY